MQMILVIGLSIILLLANSTLAEQQHFDGPDGGDDALATVDLYGAFMFAATQYMNGAPSTTGTLSWSTISQASAVSPAMRAVAMPDGWKVVAAGDGTWVACTEMEEQAASAIGQMLPASSTGSSATKANAITLNSKTYVVMDTAAAATALATQCNN